MPTANAARRATPGEPHGATFFAARSARCARYHSADPEQDAPSPPRPRPRTRRGSPGPTARRRTRPAAGRGPTRRSRRPGTATGRARAARRTPAGPSATPPGGTPPTRRPTSAAARRIAGKLSATDRSSRPAEGDAHPERERERQRPAVGVQPDERLEQRRGELEREGDEADLGEGEGVGLLQHRVDGRDQGLDRVVRAGATRSAPPGPRTPSARLYAAGSSRSHR